MGFPALPASLSAKVVVLAWSLTEVARYPMFLLPTSRAARILRYMAPLLTFPLGVAAEAYSAYLALPHLASRSGLIRFCVGLVVATNLGLGVPVGFPGIVAKAI